MPVFEEGDGAEEEGGTGEGGEVAAEGSEGGDKRLERVLWGWVREDGGAVTVDMAVFLAHGCSRLVAEKERRGWSNVVIDMGG